MEGLYNFRKGRGPSFWIPGSSEGSEDISVSEIRSRHSQISKPVQTSSVPSANIGAWLDNASSSTPGDDSDYARVALVWVNMRKDHAPWRLDIRQSSFELVVEKFGIENAYGYCSSRAAGMAAFPTSNCENKKRAAIAYSCLTCLHWLGLTTLRAAHLREFSLPIRG